MWRQTIEEHYRRCWGGFEAVEFNAGPIHQLPPDFAVLRFAPNAQRSTWVYATCCMSQPADEMPLELHILSASRNDMSLPELLYAIAHFHRTGARLGMGHSVNFGRPWLSGSECGHGLISLPYLDGPSLEWLRTGLDEVRCLWLIPVTAAEVAYKRAAGLDALEQRFEQAGFNYLDPARRSVV